MDRGRRRRLHRGTSTYRDRSGRPLRDYSGSVTACALTSDPTDAPLFRVLLSISIENGFDEACRVMVDKITTIRRDWLSRGISTLPAADMRMVDQAVPVFLGIAG